MDDFSPMWKNIYLGENETERGYYFLHKKKSMATSIIVICYVYYSSRLQVC